MAIGDILFGIGFFAVAHVVLFASSVTIYNAVKHYIDGLFFFTLCMLLSVMMVYKYWDSITKEDLEFSVGSKAAVLEVKTRYSPRPVRRRRTDTWDLVATAVDTEDGWRLMGLVMRVIPTTIPQAAGVSSVASVVDSTTRMDTRRREEDTTGGLYLFPLTSLLDPRR